MGIIPKGTFGANISMGKVKHGDGQLENVVHQLEPLSMRRDYGQLKIAIGASAKHSAFLRT